MVPLLALPAQGQIANGRAAVLAQARVIEPALAAAALQSDGDATRTEGELEMRRDATHLVLSGVAGASLGVAVKEGDATIVGVWLRLDREPRRIPIPAPVRSRAPTADSAGTTFIVELVHLGL